MGMKRILLNLSPGDIFKYAGEEFILLEDSSSEEDNLLCVLKEPFCNTVFENWSNVNENIPIADYFSSKLREVINKWFDSVCDGGRNESAFGGFLIIQNTIDGKSRYGAAEVKAAPLTFEEYIKYRVCLPEGEDFDYWLLNPYTVSTDNIRESDDYVWAVIWSNCEPTLMVRRGQESNIGARPKVRIDKYTIVEVEDETKEDDMVEEETLEKEIDLSRVSSAELLRELAFRLSGVSQDGFDEEELEDVE